MLASSPWKGKQGNFNTRTPYVKHLNHIHRGPPGPSGPRRAPTPEGHWAYRLGLSGPTYLPTCLPACLPAYHNYIHAFTCFLCFFEWTNIHLNLYMAFTCFLIVEMFLRDTAWTWGTQHIHTYSGFQTATPASKTSSSMISSETKISRPLWAELHVLPCSAQSNRQNSLSAWGSTTTSAWNGMPFGKGLPFSKWLLGPDVPYIQGLMNWREWDAAPTCLGSNTNFSLFWWASVLRRSSHD